MWNELITSQKIISTLALLINLSKTTLICFNGFTSATFDKIDLDFFLENNKYVWLFLKTAFKVNIQPQEVPKPWITNHDQELFSGLCISNGQQLFLSRFKNHTIFQIKKKGHTWLGITI